MDKNYCRLCLKQDTWNSPLSVFAGGCGILSKIFLVYGIKIFENDSFSKVICHLCLGKLEFMDGIRKEVAITNSILNGIFQAGESRLPSETQAVPQVGLEGKQPTEIRMKCDKCKFTTDIASALSAHFDLHNSVTNRSCPRCSVTVQTEDELTEHMKRKHKNRTLAIHYCTQCSKLVYGNENFNKHCQQHTTHSAIDVQQKQQQQMQQQQQQMQHQQQKQQQLQQQQKHRITKKKHKKDKVKENHSKPRERLVLKIIKTASNDDNHCNDVANKVLNEENTPETSSADNNSTTTIKDHSQTKKIPHSQSIINNSQALLTDVISDKPHTSFNDKEDISLRTTEIPEPSHTTPAKKRRMSACFVPISPINRKIDLWFQKCGPEKDGRSIETDTTCVPFGGGPEKDGTSSIQTDTFGGSVGAAIEDDVQVNQCVSRESGGEELGTNGVVDLMDSYDSESDEIYSKVDNTGKWLSDTNGNRLNMRRKRLSSSLHLQSPVVGKLLRQSSFNDKAGQELPTTDIGLAVDDWDPITASQRIYIDVDDDDDDANECAKQPSSDDSCKGYASLNRLELEDVIEIKDEYLSD